MCAEISKIQGQNIFSLRRLTTKLSDRQAANVVRNVDVQTIHDGRAQSAGWFAGAFWLGSMSHSRRPHNWNTLGRLISVRGSSVNRVKSSIADCNSDSVANFSSSNESAMLINVSTAICLPSPEANVGWTTLSFTSRHPAS